MAHATASLATKGQPAISVPVQTTVTITVIALMALAAVWLVTVVWIALFALAQMSAPVAEHATNLFVSVMKATQGSTVL
mgnify:CR=1 FL=1